MRWVRLISWFYGAVRTAAAGSGIGLIGYLSLETNGGLRLILQEGKPDGTDDDTMTMEENDSLETSTGVGPGIRSRMRAVVVKANLDAGVTGTHLPNRVSMFRHCRTGCSPKRIPV